MLSSSPTPPHPSICTSGSSIALTSCTFHLPLVTDRAIFVPRCLSEIVQTSGRVLRQTNVSHEQYLRAHESVGEKLMIEDRAPEETELRIREENSAWKPNFVVWQNPKRPTAILRHRFQRIHGSRKGYLDQRRNRRGKRHRKLRHEICLPLWRRDAVSTARKVSSGVCPLQRPKDSLGGRLAAKSAGTLLRFRQYRLSRGEILVPDVAGKYHSLP